MATTTSTTVANFFLILLLIIFSVFSTITTAQQRNSNITIGSSLSPTATTKTWLSNSGRFAFGFNPQDGGGFVVGIWFDAIPQKTIVWAANYKSPKVSNDVTLLLTSEGLILQSARGQNQSLSTKTSEPVSYASILETGNMVLYNSNSKMLWQSFDSPTNTILPGQSLKINQNLVSSVSETDYSRGKFELLMEPNGQLGQYPLEKPKLEGYSYWISDTLGAGNNVTLTLDDDGRLYLLNATGGGNVRILSESDSRSSTATNETIFYRLTIDIDGILRLYSHTLNRNGNWSIKWSSTNNRCTPKGLCGLNSYCTLLDTVPKCYCLPGFSLVDPSQERQGCSRDVDIDGCRRKGEQSEYIMQNLELTSWEEEPYSILTLSNVNSCRDACSDDCNCEVVMFVNQDCKKLKLPLRYGRRDTESTATGYVKVAARTNSTNTIGSDSKNSKKDIRLVILTASVSFVTCAFIFLGISGFLIHRFRFSSRYKILQQGSNNGLNESVSLRSFTYNELEKATNNFKEVLGRGSFGTVFKGALSNGNSLIAVKKLEKVMDEGGEREFQAEMKTIGRTHHRSLVQLLGYCHEGTNRLLVYEYMSNGTLADFLFKAKERPSWHERVQITLHIARGILYLHEECVTQIIHCDIKPQNILMDEYRFAKISDFGLAKLLKRDQTNTYTGIRGTRGYVAPEWHQNLPVTVKADVYSFGIVLLEIICCRRSLDMELNEDEVVLVDWVFQCFDTAKLSELVGDEEVDMKRFERMIKIALWCIQDEPSMRPTMKRVELMLEGTINIPNPPSPTSYLSSM